MAEDRARDGSLPASDAGAGIGGASDVDAVRLSWRSHPVREGGKRLGLVAGALVTIPGALTLLYGAFFGLLGLAMMAGSLGPYFLPTDYSLSAEGVESRFLGVSRRFTWSQFRSYYRDRNGVLLSPFLRPSRLENFRGIYLRFGKLGDRVMAVVTERIVRPPADTT